MSHKKHVTKNLIALIVIGAVFSGAILAFGNFSPNTLKTFISYNPETASSRIAFDPSAGMGINVTELTNLPNVVNVMDKMGYQILTLKNFETNLRPFTSEIEAGIPSTELMSVIMAMNPADYVTSAEGTTVIAELKEDLNTGKEITNILKSLGCTSECDNLDNHYQAGIDKLQTQRPYFAVLNLSDFIKDAIKIAPGLVPSEKPENIEDIAGKFEWLVGESNALELDNSAIKASLIKLNNLGKEKPQEKDKIIAPSGGGNGGGGNGGGGGAAIVGGGSAAKAKTAKKELSKDKSSKKSVKKSKTKSKSGIKSKDKTSKKSIKKSKSKSKCEIKSKDKTSKKSIKKSKSKSKREIKSKDKTSKKSIKKSKSKSKCEIKSKDKTSKKSIKKSKTKSKNKSSNKKSTKKSKSKTKNKSSKSSGDIPTI